MRKSAGKIPQEQRRRIALLPGWFHPKYGTNWDICALQTPYKERTRGVPCQFVATDRKDHGIAIASYGMENVLAKSLLGGELRQVGKGLELLYSIQRHKKWSMMDSKDDS